METKVDWNNIENIQNVIKESTSRVEVLKRLGYDYSSSYARQKLNVIIKKHKLDITSFNSRTERWEILPAVIKECYSISEVCRVVGLQDVGNNHQTAKRCIKEMNLDTSHFLGQRLPNARIPTDKLFIENGTACKSSIRKRVLTEQLIAYICKKCNNEGTWLDKPLTLQLEHKNGCNTDHRLENLEFLCPNCHTQTATWGRKKRE